MGLGETPHSARHGLLQFYGMIFDDLTESKLAAEKTRSSSSPLEKRGVESAARWEAARCEP
jgi:hypothetical protein